MSRPYPWDLEQAGATDGQAIAWSAANSRWEPAPAAGGAADLDDLTDVDTTTVAPTDGQVLTFDTADSLWKPATNPSGFADPTTTAGDLLRRNVGNTAVERLAIGSSGDVLTVVSGMPAWAAPSGGGSSDPTPDDPWASPSSYDYEFDASDTTSLPTGWSWVNQGTATYRERRGVGAIQKPENGIPRPLGGIARAIPSESTWTAYAKLVNTMAGGSLQLFGMSLRESATAKTYNNFVRIGGSQPSINWLYFSTATGLASETGGTAVGFGSTLYIGIKRNSATSYDALYSGDGANWRTLSTGLNPGFTPDQIGLCGWSENGQAFYLSFHWFRVITP